MQRQSIPPNTQENKSCFTFWNQPLYRDKHFYHNSKSQCVKRILLHTKFSGHFDLHLFYPLCKPQWNNFNNLRHAFCSAQGAKATFIYSDRHLWPFSPQYQLLFKLYTAITMNTWILLTCKHMLKFSNQTFFLMIEPKRQKKYNLRRSINSDTFLFQISKLYRSNQKMSTYICKQFRFSTFAL